MGLGGVGNRSSLLPKIALGVGTRGLTARGACLLLCIHFRDFALIGNKLTFLWELLYPIKIPCWGALLGPV